MQDELAKADKMTLNKPSVQLGYHEKVLLLHVKDPIAPTPNWRKSVENTEWLNAWQHVGRTEWYAVVGVKNDVDFLLPKQLSIPKTSGLDRVRIDDETKTYVEMVFSK